MMALSQTGLEFGLSAGLLIGLGLSGTTFSIVLGVIGRAFPAFVLDRGLAPRDGMIALALIGFFNIIGTYIAGLLGGKFSKKYLLSALYLGRSIVIVVFLLAPITPLSVYLFAAAIGVLWLATVPLTNGLIAQIFGTRYMSMLGGFVFFSHQIGSFLGVWLGVFSSTARARTIRCG